MSASIGSLYVRRSVWIDAPRERAWEEFETFERMKAWFGVGHDLLVYEPTVGGRLEFESAPHRFGGDVVAFEPPHELTFEDGYIPKAGENDPLLITFRLTPHLGGTHVEFFVHGFENLGAAGPKRLLGLEAGWTTLQLNRLKEVVEETSPSAVR